MIDYTLPHAQCAPAKLKAIVSHHAQTEFAKPITGAQQEAFAQACQWFDKHNKSIIIDAGCGTGLSTVMLAQKYKDCFVLGLDRSHCRLDKFHELKNFYQVDNCEVLRVNLEDFWRLLAKTNYPIIKQYLLYPNPYPKHADLKKRWYAHPTFKTIMEIAPLEVRSNWCLYLEEWAQAAALLGYHSVVENYYTDKPITRFEEKYWKAACPTYRLNFAIVNEELSLRTK